MRKQRSLLSSFRGFLYDLARGIGNLTALFKGPKATGKRAFNIAKIRTIMRIFK